MDFMPRLNGRQTTPSAGRVGPGRLRRRGQLTMRRLDSSSAISLKVCERLPPVVFQNSLAGFDGSDGSLRKRESEAQSLSPAICFFCCLSEADRSSATVITITPACLALLQIAAICSLSAAE